LSILDRDIQLVYISEYYTCISPDV
jgi:hypothetical protein